MLLELTFKEVCDLITKDEPKLLDSVDTLLGATIVCSPLVFGPAATSSLSLLGVKNELTKLGKFVFESFSKKNDRDLVGRHRRLHIAYGLICYTAFFETLDDQLPVSIRTRLSSVSLSDLAIPRNTPTDIDTDVADRKPPNTDALAGATDPFSAVSIPLPHPTESLTDLKNRNSKLYHQMADGFREFIQHQSFWSDFNERERSEVVQVITRLPAAATERFEIHYFELCRKYEDFAIWANLHEHKKTKTLITSLTSYVRTYVAFAKAAQHNVDVGFKKLNTTVMTLPALLKVSRSEEITDGLKRHYTARLSDPIIDDKEEYPTERPRLSFPRVRDAFVPQSFRVLRQHVKARRLEDDETWKSLPRRDDLGPFLFSYLTSPYSTETPLVILGHPGSGKSLLTTVLSAQLMSESFTAIRVPLREVDSEAGIVAQIEEQIGRITNIRLDSWAKVSGGFKNSPPIVILDGYDELLQASGKVFAGYLKDVQTFQKNEAEQGRPVRVIVTSRITLIDKATIPINSTIVRLLEFDRRQRDYWTSIWNATNVHYFKETVTQPFELPKEGAADAAKILSLAEQPLLLLMLALYDSEDNKLRDSKSLDRTVLYESLLRRFVARERGKTRTFTELTVAEQRRELDAEMNRLGVAAIGMYNRRKLHILSSELNDDLKFFGVEREVSSSPGRALTQADLLLGSFFFVHKSRAQQKAGAEHHHEETSAFEFLHNTFGEFLTADFVLRQAFGEIEAMKALKASDVLRGQLDQKMESADGLSRAWFASLVYTPLFTRPVVVEMIREWTVHMLMRRKISRSDFLALFDELLLNQITRVLSKREMPAIMRKEAAQEGYRAPFGDHPLLGHIAIYSLNLILLRASVSKDAFELNEGMLRQHQDGARPWDQLTHVWRSWFSMENLSAFAAIVTAVRRDSNIHLSCNEAFTGPRTDNRLEMYFNVSMSVADNVAAGLSGLLLHEAGKEPSTLDDVASRLSAENIDLRPRLTFDRLDLLAGNESVGLEEFVAFCGSALDVALRFGRQHDIDRVVRGIRDGLRRRLPHSLGREYRERHSRDGRDSVDRLFHPGLVSEIVERSPEAALDMISIIKDFGGSRWTDRFGDEILDRVLHPRQLVEIIERRPEWIIALVQFARHLHFSWHRRHADELFHRVLEPHSLGRLVRWHPAAAASLIEFALESGAYGWVERTGHDDFQEIFSGGNLIDLAEANPEATVAILEALHSVHKFEWSEDDRSALFRSLCHPRRVLDMINDHPLSGLALIKLARAASNGILPNGYTEDILEHLIASRVLVRLMHRDPIAGLTVIRLLRENQQFTAPIRIPEELIERQLSASNLARLTRRHPDLALVFLQLASDFADEHWARHEGSEYIKISFGDGLLIDIIRRNVDLAIGVLRLARLVTEEARAKLRADVRRLVATEEGRSLIAARLPLQALSDLQWLRTGDQQEPESRPMIALVSDLVATLHVK